MQADSSATPDAQRISLLWTILALVIITTVGLYLRAQVVDQTQTPKTVIADAQDYFAYAFNLRNHGIYSRDIETYLSPQAVPEPDAVRAPGYPAFLSLFMGPPVDQSTLARIKWAQVALSTLTILITFFVARLFLPTVAALLASLFTALSPHLINLNLYLLTETLFALILVVTAWVLGRAWQGQRSVYVWWAVCGLLLAAGSLVRPSLQYFIVAAVALGLLALGRRQGLKAATLAVLVFAVIMGAWSLRNYQATGELSDDKLMINAIHHGLYPGFRYQDDPRTYGYPYRYDPRSEEISQSVSTALAEVGRRFKDEPLRHLQWYLLGKPLSLWSWGTIQGAGGGGIIYPVENSPYEHSAVFRATYKLMHWAHWPLVFLGALGSLAVWVPALARRLPPDRRLAARAVSAVLIYFTLIHVIVQPFPRYSIPLRPLLFSAALLGITLFITGQRGETAVADTTDVP